MVVVSAPRDPVNIPGVANANIMVARNDSVPVTFRIRKYDDLGASVPVDLTGDTWTLLIEWENDVIRMVTNSGEAHGFGVDLAGAQVVWFPQPGYVDRIPKDCATYSGKEGFARPPKVRSRSNHFPG